MSHPEPVIHVVDDDPSHLKAVCRLLRAAGHAVQAYASAETFLAAGPPSGPGCAVLDVCMPGLDGLQLQAALAKARDPLPVLFLTGHGDIPATVRAMKAGAVDFLTKPAKGRDLLEAVRQALGRDAQARRRTAELGGLRARYGTLSRREREVFAGVVAGRLNKQIAADLGMVERTVKAHRAHIVEKLGEPSVAGLVRLAEALGLFRKPPAVS
jgi:FixJ family two-component response regulator